MAFESPFSTDALDLPVLHKDGHVTLERPVRPHDPTGQKRNRAGGLSGACRLPKAVGQQRREDCA